jgi:hypothetical protein
VRRFVIVSAVWLVVAGSGCGGLGDRSDVRLDKGEPWDLVWFSDSMGQRVAGEWADLIEEAEGVEVRVHDHWSGFAPIDQFLQMIGDVESIRREVAEAEIIVVYGNASRTGPPDTEVCHLPLSADPDPPGFYTSADLAAYGDVFRDVFEVIFELRAGEPTVIRAFDVFAGALVDWREAGVEAECTATWEAEAAAIREAADEYGVVTASFYDAFNGTDHDEDPREKGYIAFDGYHASPRGSSAQAQVLHSLGYDAIIP